MHKAIALYSGGIDSLLAILLIKKQSIQVIAFKFITGFDSKVEDNRDIAKKFSFELEKIDIREKFIEIVKNPKHGYGKNLNPCIDCKILMLNEAKIRMDDYKASFIITGEVLGQRPMTQRREIFSLMEKETLLKGLILRPLSAKLLFPTKPELEGVVNRELLYDIFGRTRKPQLSLAKEFGVEKIPQPAGGCLLTDPNFCKKLKDLLVNNEMSIENVELLKIGRHLRVSEKCKIIVGRDKKENETLLKNYSGLFLYPADFKGPVVAVQGQYDEKEIETAASICVYYSKRKKTEIVVRENKIERKKIYDAISEVELVKYRDGIYFAS